ncbi:myozenin-1-like isoform X1 [Brienomyrus brachyistius]|uniref:myozenin-1-like isoform X1 n=1 Tax=Brienomyrus brachyistius TaxID=42636 RepID=UPI0020B4263C|nr:myozenin-1-like isoform X1 [Brienomyrus brachyistius]
MPLSVGPEWKKSTKLITDFSNITQDDPDMHLEPAELDLGKKIKAPKEVMLEELSLLNNKGSRMFKMRQQRVERFVFENNPDLQNQGSMNLISSLVGEIAADLHQSGVKMEVELPEAEAGRDAAGEEPGDSTPQEKRRECVKTYLSPWERAMKGDEELLATMRVEMPGPHLHHDPPTFKSFNRTALPYGGLENAPPVLLQPPEVPLASEEPELLTPVRDVSLRPSFNRTPMGWVFRGEPSRIHVEMDAGPFDVETEDL